jgi:hypothetical protein
MFAVEASAWARWKGILIENIKNIKNNNNFFFLLGFTENEPKKRIFNIFQSW